MTACKYHYTKRNNTNDQPQRAVIVGDHHVVTDHAPHHHRDPDQQRNNGLPAEAFHGGDSRFLLTFAAFGIIFDGLCAIARFSTACTNSAAEALPMTSAVRSARLTRACATPGTACKAFCTGRRSWRSSCR